MSDPQGQWAQVLLGGLVEAGVREVVISPGSRSTPLVWAATHDPRVRCHCIIDERSAGFFALGQARISGMPSLLLCTSGSAPSHYFPAVIEARVSGLPLIVLSADRPFELQHCGAHQTIDQTRLFGTYASYHELGTPVADRDALLGVRRMARQAVAASLEAPRGAAHLNFRARKPLEPRLGGARAVALPELSDGAPIVSPPPREPTLRDLDWLLASLDASDCPLLICGASSVQDSPSAALVRRFAELSGGVVCPESVSQQRFALNADGERGLVCDVYDWLLGCAALKQQLLPDFALQLGASPVSSSLERMIQDGADRLTYAVCAESGWPDPLHKSARILRSGSSQLLSRACAALESRPRRAPSRRLRLWQQATSMARAAVREHLALAFGEAAAVATVVNALPERSVFAVGNSLPPRLIDRYCPAAERGIRICSQRGASGIEGGIAGALGAASQAESPTTALLGDISFLHDVGSLWAARAEHTHVPAPAHPVVIVVLNNAGGRIFEQLPIASYADVSLHFWTTPHQLQLRAAAELYGIAFAQAHDASGLAAALAGAYSRRGVSLVEVVVQPDSAMQSLRSLTAELEPQLAELARRGVE